MTGTHWDKPTYLRRIKDTTRRERYAAGSPDAVDLADYASALRPVAGGTALVLGMTPELRRLAFNYADRVVTADANADAIALFRDWVMPQPPQSERIINTDWFRLADVHPEPFDIILGDGIFGNLPDVEAHRNLLATLHTLLAKDGIFATRTALLPDPATLARYRCEELLRLFRSDAIDDAEFGLTLRLFGFHAQCHDETQHLLDNRCVFAHCDTACRDGLMTEQELAIVHRYYYAGRNCLLPKSAWENLLSGTGFAFSIPTKADKMWREYYPVYSCRAAEGTRATGYL